MKHGFAQDMRLVELILSSDLADRRQLERIISKTIELKLAHYHETETKWKEIVPTKLLTHVGHSVGKVIESLCLGAVSHGEAISHGVVAESTLSVELGLLSPDGLELIQSALYRLRLLPTLPASCSAGAILARLLREQTEPTFALLAALGQTRVANVSISSDIVSHALKKWRAAVS
jgi:3-dehydroquinate synthetase